MAKINTPNPAFSGDRYGVHFENGEAHTTDKTKIQWFKQNGYFVDGKLDNEAVAKPVKLPETPTIEEDESDLEEIGDEETEEDDEETTGGKKLRPSSLKLKNK